MFPYPSFVINFVFIPKIAKHFIVAQFYHFETDIEPVYEKLNLNSFNMKNSLFIMKMYLILKNNSTVFNKLFWFDFTVIS